MKKKNFTYELSNVDYRPLYTHINYLRRYCDLSEIPEILVVEEIEDGSSIMRCVEPNGKETIFLKNSENMIKTLENELEFWEKSKVVKDVAYGYHSLTNQQVWNWISLGCQIAKMLEISCPPILFTHDNMGGHVGGLRIIGIPDTFNFIELFTTLAHELRHEWQYINHPEIFDGYVPPEEDIEAYENHPAEIDAEAYGLKLAKIVFFDRKINYPVDAALLEKINRRASEINITLSESELDFFRTTLEEIEKSEGL